MLDKTCLEQQHTILIINNNYQKKDKDCEVQAQSFPIVLQSHFEIQCQFVKLHSQEESSDEYNRPIQFSVIRTKGQRVKISQDNRLKEKLSRTTTR